VSPADLGHEFTRWGPFLLVLLWAGMVAVFRKRPPRAPEPPAPPRVVQRPPPAVPRPISLAYTAVGRPAPVSEAEAERALAVAQIEATALAAQAEADVELQRERRVGNAWAQAVVLTEILGPPLALRRPGTLGPPGAL